MYNFKKLNSTTWTCCGLEVIEIRLEHNGRYTLNCVNPADRTDRIILDTLGYDLEISIKNATQLLKKYNKRSLTCIFLGDDE